MRARPARRPAAARTAHGARSRAAPPRACRGSAAAAASRSSAICDGASGRGGRASIGRRLPQPIGHRRSARAAPCLAASRGSARALAFPHQRRRPSPRPRPPPRRALASPAPTAACQLPCGTSALRLDPGDDQPLGGAGQADIGQPPMLLLVGLLGLVDQRRGKSARIRPCADGRAGPSPTPGIGKSRIDDGAADLVRVVGRVGEDHERRLEALGAVDGHHPHRIRRRGRDRASPRPRPGRTRRGSGRARRFPPARTPARWRPAPRSGRAPPRPAAEAACAGRRAGPTGSSRGSAPAST